jgi:hypothetical protein
MAADQTSHIYGKCFIAYRCKRKRKREFPTTVKFYIKFASSRMNIFLYDLFTNKNNDRERSVASVLRIVRCDGSNKRTI